MTRNTTKRVGDITVKVDEIGMIQVKNNVTGRILVLYSEEASNLYSAPR